MSRDDSKLRRDGTSHRKTSPRQTPGALFSASLALAATLVLAGPAAAQNNVFVNQQLLNSLGAGPVPYGQAFPGQGLPGQGFVAVPGGLQFPPMQPPRSTLTQPQAFGQPFAQQPFGQQPFAQGFGVPYTQPGLPFYSNVQVYSATPRPPVTTFDPTYQAQARTPQFGRAPMQPVAPSVAAGNGQPQSQAFQPSAQARPAPSVTAPAAAPRAVPQPRPQPQPQPPRATRTTPPPLPSEALAQREAEDGNAEATTTSPAPAPTTAPTQEARAEPSPPPSSSTPEPTPSPTPPQQQAATPEREPDPVPAAPPPPPPPAPEPATPEPATPEPAASTEPRVAPATDAESEPAAPETTDPETATVQAPEPQEAAEPASPPPPSPQPRVEPPAGPSAEVEPAVESPAPEPQQQAALPPEPDTAVQEDVLARVLFTDGQDEVAAEGNAALNDLAQSLQADESRRIQLLAYAAGDSSQVNQARRLSLSRALAVRQFLIAQGIRSTRMDVRALGNNIPDGPPNRVDIVPAPR
ncbi:MAG: OmpA family protein [Kiloniellales bacterium]